MKNKRAYEVAVLSKGAFARTVRIYSPKKADRVIIMHDGQNAFYDGEAAYGMSWRALDALKLGGIKNTAIVGIDSVPSTRYDDYLPFPSPSAAPQTGGKARVYIEYILGTVLPYLKKRFGYDKFGMIGSSAGALATLAVAAEPQKEFNAYGMYSTPLFACGDAYDEFFATASFDGDACYRVFCGGNEDIAEERGKTPQLFVDDAHKLINGLRRGGARNIIYDFDNRAEHNEVAWRMPFARFVKEFSEL